MKLDELCKNKIGDERIKRKEWNHIIPLIDIFEMQRFSIKLIEDLEADDWELVDESN